MVKTQDKVSIQVGEPTGLTDEETEEVLFEESLVNILENNEPIPEFLDVDEAILLRCALPAERMTELAPLLKQLLGSLDAGKRPTDDYDGWFYLSVASTRNSFEQKLALLMLSLQAKSFTEWFALYVAVEAKTQSVLKKFTAQTMLDIAQTPTDKKTARAKAREVHLKETGE